MKSYSLNVLPDGSRQFVNIEPAANKVIVYLQSGQTAIRCGVNTQAYSCQPGNPLEITATPDTPINQLWAENLWEQLVALKIDVLETAVTAAEDETITPKKDLSTTIEVEAETSVDAKTPVDAETPEPIKPLKSYSLSVLPDRSKQFVNIEPPANKIIVYLQSGETAVRCGVSTQAYSCKPGNPLEITATPDTPIKQFWAENLSKQPVGLKIDVLDAVAHGGNPQDRAASLLKTSVTAAEEETITPKKDLSTTIE